MELRHPTAVIHPDAKIDPSVKIGPYAVIEYEPAIDYGSWSYAVVSRGAPDRIPEHRWTPGELPASSIGLVLREGETLYWRGFLRSPADGRVGRLAVSVIGDHPPEMVEARSGKTGLSRLAQYQRVRNVRQTDHGSVAYWANETVFELPQRAEARDIPLLIGITGQGRFLSGDVFEASSP